MRPLLFVLAIVFVRPAFAAPICFTRAADIVHCDVKAAMPVGWRPSAEQFARRALEQPQPSTRDILKVVLGLVLFFALIALLPEFDGARDQDWDTQEKQDRD
jgi:hypothetical protein